MRGRWLKIACRGTGLNQNQIARAREERVDLAPRAKKTSAQTQCTNHGGDFGNQNHKNKRRNTDNNTKLLRINEINKFLLHTAHLIDGALDAERRGIVVGGADGRPTHGGQAKECGG